MLGCKTPVPYKPVKIELHLLHYEPLKFSQVQATIGFKRKIEGPLESGLIFLVME
jgi:hypothetical protein